MKRLLMQFVFFNIFFLVIPMEAFTQICVGDPGKATWEAWRGVPDDEMSELSAWEFYPSTPDKVRTVYSTKTPFNYDNYFGSRIRGFIKVPVSDSVTFNVTGNQKVEFYLSTDSTAANMQLIASAPDWTNTEEHSKFAEQTSLTVWIDSSIYYYYEIRQVESSGYDFAYLYWKSSFLPTTDWHIITSAYLYDVGCLPSACPERGTPCDDGDSSTVDDEEDGHCHCVGIPQTTNSCIGDRGKVERYRYDNIPGGDLYDLYESTDFPAMPSYSERLDQFGVTVFNSQSDQGNLVQAYLTVPVTGDYKFNITGDDETILFISSDDTPENKQAHQVLVTGWTNMTEHDKYLWQSTSNIFLETGKYYYVEINHKQGGGNRHFQAFWQTPYSGAVWKRIPSFYMYDYQCDIACIPQGTLCDDGNPYTNNDMYDANCQCVGTPCSGPDCDSPLASYVPYEKCGLTEQIDNRPDNNWLSCTPLTNPNPIRPISHWIQYDLGERYQVFNSRVWNYNVQDQTSKGFKMVAVDYSEDGVSWNHLGDYNWSNANGQGNYSGFVGPDFGGEYARYILISSLEGTSECRGLGKITFNALKCPLAGTVCDDGNIHTANDMYNDACECIGTSIYNNECIDQDLVLGDSLLAPDLYSAINTLLSNSDINGNDFTSFVAGDYVELLPGFETYSNTHFLATIDTCSQNLRIPYGGEMARSRKELKEKQELEKLNLLVKEGSDVVTAIFYVERPQRIILNIEQNGETHYTIIDHEYRNRGIYTKRFRTKKLIDGSYRVVLVSEDLEKGKVLEVKGE